MDNSRAMLSSMSIGERYNVRNPMKRERRTQNAKASRRRKTRIGHGHGEDASRCHLVP